MFNNVLDQLHPCIVLVGCGGYEISGLLLDTEAKAAAINQPRPSMTPRVVHAASLHVLD